jgi:hypothetical protein
MSNDLYLPSYEDEKMNTKTFVINTLDECMGGKIDGIEALKQSIYMMLNTEADQHIIYPYTYGMKTIDLIGKPSYYVVGVLPNRITETLMKDTRITNVSDFEFEINRNKLTVKFTVHSVYGDFKDETGVTF